MARLPKPFYTRRGWHGEGLFNRQYIGAKYENPEDRWKPPSKLYVKEAIEAFGRIRVAAWDGTEPSARGGLDPPMRPWLHYGSERQRPKVLTFNEEGKALYVDEVSAEKWWLSIEGKLIEEWEAERSAVLRWKEASNGLRNLLAEGQLIATSKDREGFEHEMPQRLWLAEMAEAFLRNGFARYSDDSGYTVRPFDGVVLIDKASLERVLSGGPSASHSNEGFEIDGVLHPYLAFMLRAAREIRFATGSRTPKKLIVAWLQSNWPDGLGTPTETKLDAMATFLRRPEDESGGNLRGNPAPKIRTNK